MTDTVKHYINHCEENVINISESESSEESDNIEEQAADIQNFDSVLEIHD